MISRAKSEALFAESLKHIPGGVNSPVRAFRGVGGQPFFAERAVGSHVWDVDGNEYIDYVGTWGPAILGHTNPSIIEAVKNAAEQGASFGIPNEHEVRMAQLVKKCVPSVEKIRMVNSGTEACMSAIRVARGFTDRPKIIKFDGCYHGHADSLLVKAGSGALTCGNPDSAGVPTEFTAHTIVLPFNDPAAVEEAFTANQGKVAGIILEPVPGNAGVYLPQPGYLEFLREITQANESLLIFDEVMTGFRVSLGGAQEHFGITPDLSCFGKIIGGGLPVGAFGGRAEIMDVLAPDGPVYQAGTLSGNPLAMVAGAAALEQLQSGKIHRQLETSGAKLETGLNAAAKKNGIAVTIQRIGSMICTFFIDHPVHNLAEAMQADRERFKKYFHGMLAEGVYLAPSPYETGFISSAHSDEDIHATISAAEKVMATL